MPAFVKALTFRQVVFPTRQRRIDGSNGINSGTFSQASKRRWLTAAMSRWNSPSKLPAHAEAMPRRRSLRTILPTSSSGRERKGHLKRLIFESTH